MGHGISSSRPHCLPCWNWLSWHVNLFVNGRAKEKEKKECACACVYVCVRVCACVRAGVCKKGYIMMHFVRQWQYYPFLAPSFFLGRLVD